MSWNLSNLVSTMRSISNISQKPQVCVCACMCVCVRACVRACVCACVRAFKNATYLHYRINTTSEVYIYKDHKVKLLTSLL